MIQAATQSNSAKSPLKCRFFSFVSRSPDTWLSTFSIACFAAAICIVFWSHISGSAVFIGESDRLNSYLNIRLAEYDALKQYGRVPAWNSTMFGGFSMAALHWMNPGKDPVPYLLQFVSREDVFRSLGYLSIFMVFAACVTAFLYIRDVTHDISSAAVGALSYGLSVFSLHRAAQVDNAHLTVILIPIALLAIRRAGPNNLAKPFLGLAITMALLAFWGFLQEVAYAFIFFGSYALYRACIQKKRGYWYGLPPVTVMGLASALALTFAMPRLLTIANDFSLLDRTSALHGNNYSQVLRFFHEGIYGRYFGEGRLLGHGMNLHEGLQLVSSAALSLFVCFGIARPSSPTETVAALVFFALLVAILPLPEPLYVLANEQLPISVELFKAVLYGSVFTGLILAVKKSRALSQRRAAHRPSDTTFHLFALTCLLFLILIPEGTKAVYALFGGVDFTHTRLSVLLILPLCTLFSIYLAELKQATAGKGIKRPKPVHPAITAAVFCLAGIAAYFSQSSFLEGWVPRDAFRIFVLDDHALMPTIAVSVVLVAILLSLLMTAALALRPKRPDAARLAGLAVAVFVTIETIGYARLKMEGAQTWTYPIPFQTFNYLNVDLSVLRPPEASKRKTVQASLESDRYRTVGLSDKGGYSGTKISHLAEFWEFRTIGGYGTGVAQRLASLPWPKDVKTLRTIDFTSTPNLDASIFPLLAFLNVKYLLLLTPDVYFNVPTRNLSDPQSPNDLSIGGQNYRLRAVNVEDISFHVLENPVKPLPRHFMVRQVIGDDLPPAPEAKAAAPAGFGPRVFQGQVEDLTHTSFVEGRFVGTTRKFDASGDLDVSYRGDVIDVRVTPSAQERFLVLSETYNPQWRVYAGDFRAETVPTNLVMNGVLIPPGLDRVTLRFEPFSSQRWAAIMMLAALVGFVFFIFVLRRTEGSRTAKQ